MKAFNSRLLILTTTLMALGLVSSAANAMPNFARKYAAACSMCHTQVPKLNRVGYDFRNAGFRMPEDIGVNQEFELADLMAARIQEQYVYQDHNDVKAGKDFTDSQLKFFEATLYPLSGSWGKNFGSLSELSMAPGDVFEVENAYVRGAWGNPEGWFQVRVGVMHPWEGFGASDRPMGNVRPLIQKQRNGAQQGNGGETSVASGSPFYLWNLDESAIEVGYNFAKSGTSIAGRISNGLVWEPDAPNFVDPAQGGNLSKSTSYSGHNKMNYQFFVNQFINDDSAISLYYYNGRMPYAMPGETPAGNIPLVKFERLAVYVNYFVLPELNLLGGYAWGKDDVNVADVAALAAANPGLGFYNPTKLGNSGGYFLEANYFTTHKLGLGFRYDSFDPTDTVGHNSQAAYTFSANWSIFEGLQLIGDYQHKSTDQSAGGANKDDTVTIRGILIF